MEVTIERNELLASLYLVQGIVERRTTIPILGNVLIQTGKSGITIAATDQEIAVRRQCKADVKQKGSLTTGARKFYEMIREFGEGPVAIRSLENNWIEVSAGRSRFRLVGMDSRDFPAMPEPSSDKGRAWKIGGEVLTDMIEHTVFAVSADETRVNLNGIFAECSEEGRLRMVATDGHRLAMITRDVESAEPGKGVIIPRKAVMELRKVLESGNEPLEISIDEGVAHAIRGSVQMSMRLVEGEFPDYQQVIPSKSERKAIMAAGELLAALRRVSIVSSERTRGVRLQLESEKLELSSINPDVGEAAEEIEVEYEGDPVGVGFNAKYLIDALSVLSSEERIEIGLNDELSPGAIRRPDDPDYCYIVMPMRL